MNSSLHICTIQVINLWESDTLPGLTHLRVYLDSANYSVWYIFRILKYGHLNLQFNVVKMLQEFTYVILFFKLSGDSFRQPPSTEDILLITRDNLLINQLVLAVLLM